MDTITVRKSDLISTLETNREEHRSIFLKAQDRYRERFIELLEQRLEDARQGRSFDQWIRLPVPEDHTRDFDTAIEMLHWDTGENVTIDRHDFQRYVQNNWEWQQSFTANTVAYVADALPE
jgi:sensor c-di-GMP phosphodiesterase-like protein